MAERAELQENARRAARQHARRNTWEEHLNDTIAGVDAIRYVRERLYHPPLSEPPVG
jgi:hypothetical protein